MDKALLREAIVERLQQDLDNLTRAAHMAHDEATHEESKPENKYDMHSQQAAYLAEGQARLALELQESLKLFRALPLPAFPSGAPIALGAFVVAESGPRKFFYFVGPRNGGIEIESEGLNVVVITPQSPLGRQLLGKKIGDALVQSAGGRNTTLHIAYVE